MTCLHVMIPSIVSPRTLCSSALRPVFPHQPSHLCVACTSVQDGVRVDEPFVPAGIYSSAHLVSTREVHTAYVKPVDMRRQHTTDKENAVDQAVGTEVVEEPYGQRWEEYVENGYADSIAQCPQHCCCLSVLTVVVWTSRDEVFN